MSRLVIRIGGKGKRASESSVGYRLKPSSFLLSTLIHALAISLLALVHADFNSPRNRRPVYETLIRPNEKTIIWYDLRKALPEVPATRKIGKAALPQGAVPSQQPILAHSKDGKNSKQLVWVPLPELRMKNELRSPNVIAMTTPPVPAPPAPTPPEITPSLPSPPVRTETALNITKQPPRAFVAPPEQARPRLATPTPVLLPDQPSLASSVLGSTMNAAGPPQVAKPSKLPTAPFVPPPDRSRHPGVEASGNPNSLAIPAPSIAVAPGNINVAVVGLNPVEGPVRPPEGSRPAQFSTAPNVGPPATGDVETGPGSIPDLSIQGAKTAAARSAGNNTPAMPPIAQRPAKMVLYQQMDGGVELHTLSTPLRPSSRSIPRALEARFQGRSVYTLVIPAPNMPDYTGDWIMWFAGTETATGVSPLIRAPVPYRKLQPIESTPDRTEARVQVAVLIDVSGHLRPFAPVQLAGALTEAALDDILRWEFRPATYNGNPIEVEAVIEVPIRIAQQARAKVPAQ